MIKKYLKTWVLLISAVLMIASCTNREKEIAAHTKAFLDAYFNIDYKAASGFCTKELGSELIGSLKSLDSLEPSVRAMLEKQSKEAKTEIISIKADNNKDTAKVLYKVILPSFPKGIENTLSLVKMDKKWWVVALGDK